MAPEIQPVRKSEAESVAEVVRKHIEPKLLESVRGNAQKAPFILAQKSAGGVEAISIKAIVDEYLEKPDRRKGTARLNDLASFIALATRFKDSDSALFADPSMTSPSLLCVFDYNPPGSDNKAARFGQHRAYYSFPLSKEWQAWAAMDGKPMDVQKFAEFLEDRIGDVSDPITAGGEASKLVAKLGTSFASPQKLLELSNGLSLRVGQAVKQAVKLTTGEVQVHFVTSHTDEQGKPLMIPGAFLLTIPVFQNGAPYEIAARLRYRASDGKITWFYQMHRLDLIFEHAFEEACNRAVDETKLPLYVGNPET